MKRWRAPPSRSWLIKKCRANKPVIPSWSLQDIRLPISLFCFSKPIFHIFEQKFGRLYFIYILYIYKFIFINLSINLNLYIYKINLYLLFFLFIYFIYLIILRLCWWLYNWCRLGEGAHLTPAVLSLSFTHLGTEYLGAKT